MMNNLMFHPFVTGSISVIFPRYKLTVSDERDATNRKGDRCPMRYATDKRRTPKNIRQKRYNIIISVTCGLTHLFLNGRHLSSDGDDTSYLLPFDSLAVRSFHNDAIIVGILGAQ